MSDSSIMLFGTFDLNFPVTELSKIGMVLVNLCVS